MEKSTFRVRSHSVMQLTVFCIVLAVVGILFSSLSTVVVVSYTTQENFNYARLDGSQNRTLTILPNSSVSYHWQPWLFVNGSLVQISLTSSGKLNVSLYNNLNPAIDEQTELLMQFELGEGFRDAGEYGNYWVIHYWVPPGPRGYDPRSEQSWLNGTGPSAEMWAGDPSFIFTNPESFENTITYKIDVYFPNAIGEREITNYRSAIDPLFFYVGIGLLVMATAVESEFLFRHNASHQKDN